MPFYIVDWHSSDTINDNDNDDEEDEDDDSSAEKKGIKLFTIKAFCIDNAGKSVMVNIHNFKPYFFIKIPNNWTTSQANIFVNTIKDKVDKWVKNSLIDFKLVKAKPFYGFTASDKFLYLKLSFSSLNGFHKYGALFKDNNKIKVPTINGGQPYYYEPYESNLQPLLRFIHCRDINAAGWMDVTNFKEVHNNTTCDYEIACEWTDIAALPDKNDIPPIKYVGFDIEADSSHGDFPIAKKNYQKLAEDIITAYNSLSTREKNKRHIIACFLYYAFHKSYNNNKIQPVKLQHHYQNLDITITDILSGYSENQALIDKYSPAFLELMDEPEDQSVIKMLEIFEYNFPQIAEDSDSDYFNLSTQIWRDFHRLKSINDQDLSNNPLGVIKILLKLAFDPYYRNLNINRIYTRGNIIPSAELLTDLIPTIYDICEKAHDIVLQERKNTKYRLMKIKNTKDPKQKDAEKVDDCVIKLIEVLNKYLPTVKDDRVIQIGSTFKRYGETDCYLKHIICLNGCSPISNETMIEHEFQGVEIPPKELIPLAKKMGLEIIPDLKLLNSQYLAAKKAEQLKTDKAKVVVECYNTEAEVLLAWRKLIIRENPDILAGYNIFGFDYKFLYERAEQLGIVEEFSKLGRIKGISHKLIEQKLQSAGMGDNLLHYIEMYGRVSIDLYKVMQKLEQLDSYKLDDVCMRYLYKSKVDVSPQDIFIKQKGSDADRCTIAEYCLIDCILCNRLMDKFEIIINNIGMAQVCSVPFSYLFSRGQGIKLFSYVAKRSRTEGYLIPVLGEAEDEGKYEGAIVLNPIKGIHYDVVAVADFNSLYPSCMISENLSHNSFVGSITVGKGEPTDFRGRTITDSIYESNLIQGQYLGWDYVDIVYDVYKAVPVGIGRKKTHNIVVGHKICRFAQPPDGKKDIIPNILMDLLKQRSATRKIQKNHAKGTFLYNIYEGLQLAYKVTANSLYGIIGANTSQIRLKEIAACTTAKGRMLITMTSNYITKNYPGSRIVYGDTDSVFASFKCTDRKGRKLQGLDAVMKSIMLCTEAAMLISKQLKYPHNLEFEKAIFAFILLSKKRYHGDYYSEYGNADHIAKSMGIVLKRRDNAPIVKHVFGGMIKIIMDEHSIEKAIKFVMTECDKVLRGEFPLDMFVITKTLRSYYKNPTQIAHNVLAMRIAKRDPGNKPNSNDRIPYVYIINPDAEMQGDRIETPDYVTKYGCKIDYCHYITNQICKPVMQIFDLAGKGSQVFNTILAEYDFRISGQRRLAGPGIRMIDRKTKNVKVDVKVESDAEDSSDSDSSEDEEEDA